MDCNKQRRTFSILAVALALFLSACANNSYDAVPVAPQVAHEMPSSASQLGTPNDESALDNIITSDLRSPTGEAETAARSGPSISDTVSAATLIKQSRDAYSGSCACPYDVDTAGRKCGARSAYSRGGGASPLCYPSDLKGEQIKAKAIGNASACGGSYYGATSCITGLPRTTYVSGYYRKNGTYVQPYYRSSRR